MMLKGWKVNWGWNTVTKIWAGWMGLSFNYEIIVPMDISCPYVLEGLSVGDQGLEVWLAW